MANNHVYGFRYKNSYIGQDLPQVRYFPVQSAYAPNTLDAGGGTAVNLNIGDPVRVRQDGTIRLTQTGQDITTPNTAQADSTYGIIVGFPRGITRGGIGPNSFFTSGTTYTGGIGADAAIVAAVMPVFGNTFELDTDALISAAGGTPALTRSGALSLVGQTCRISYVNVLTSGIGQPKANPLILTSDLVAGGANQGQLLITGLGRIDQDQDYTATNVTFEVQFTYPQLSQQGDPAIFGAKN